MAFKAFGSIFAVICFFAISAVALAQTGEVHGEVTDENHRPVPGIQIWLTGDDGETWVTESREDGRYQFSEIEEGYYSLRVQAPEGWLITSPEAGYSELYMDPGGEVIINIDLKGVTIDFGKPPSTGGGGTNGKTWLASNGSMRFQTMVRVQNLERWFGEKPKVLVIEGQWLLKASPDAQIHVVNAQPRGAYSNAKVDFENLDQNRFRLVLRTSGWPGLAFSGDAILLDLAVLNGLADADIKTKVTGVFMSETAIGSTSSRNNRQQRR